MKPKKIHKRYIVFKYEENMNLKHLKSSYFNIFSSLYGQLDSDLYDNKLFIRNNLLFLSTPVQSLYKSFLAIIITYYKIAKRFPHFIGIYPTVKKALKKFMD